MENAIKNKCSNAKLHPDRLPEFLVESTDEESWHAVILVLTFVFQGIMGKPGERGPKGERVCTSLL